MRDFRDAKAMAQTLREALKPKSISLTLSESLELVAKMLGFRDWNELSAKIQSESQPLVGKPATIIPTSGEPTIWRRADLPTVALPDIVVFPEMIVPIHVGRDTTKRAIERAMAEDRRFLAVTQRRSGDDNPRRADLYGAGVIASIIDLINMGDGTIKVLIKCLKRVTIVQMAEEPFLTAEVTGVEDSRGTEEEAIALARAVKEETHRKSDLRRPHWGLFSLTVEDPSALADAVPARLSCEISQQQELLETGDVVARLQKILALMKTDQQAA